MTDPGCRSGVYRRTQQASKAAAFGPTALGELARIVRTVDASRPAGRLVGMPTPGRFMVFHSVAGKIMKRNSVI